MPKSIARSKTKKAVAKRFKITASGKVLRAQASRRHLASSKNAKRKRHASKAARVDKTDLARIKANLPVRLGLSGCRTHIAARGTGELTELRRRHGFLGLRFRGAAAEVGRRTRCRIGAVEIAPPDQGRRAARALQESKSANSSHFTPPMESEASRPVNGSTTVA